MGFSPSPLLLPIVALGALFGAAGAGAGAAWLMHRRTRLSPRNLYLAAALLLGAAIAAGALLGPLAGAALLPGLVAAVAGSVVGRQLRGSALGAGGELRAHERGRLMLWQAASRDARHSRARERARGERTFIVGQGELVREPPGPPARLRSRSPQTAAGDCPRGRAGT